MSLIKKKCIRDIRRIICVGTPSLKSVTMLPKTEQIQISVDLKWFTYKKKTQNVQKILQMFKKVYKY